MKPVNLTKEERRRRREADIAAYQALTPEQQEAFIAESKKHHADAFQIKKAKEDEKQAWRREGIARLCQKETKIFIRDCNVCIVEKPARRDKETKELLEPAQLRLDGKRSFTVTLAVRPTGQKVKAGRQKMLLAFSIKSPKDSDNRRDASAHLGYRLEPGNPYTIEFSVPEEFWDEKSYIWNNDLEIACWDEFTAFVRRNTNNLPTRFVRSWFYDLERNH